MDINQNIEQPVTPRYKLLIVDDAPMNRDVLRRIFEDTYIVMEAENGVDAFRVIEENNYEVDVILLDLLMPVMDGTEFLLKKRNNPRIEHIPTIVITSVESVEQQVQLLELGASDYIHKPFHNSIVKIRVDNVLQASLRYNQVVKAYSEAMEIARTDSLTGIYNRATTQKLIENILQLEVSHTHALFMIDIDNFKMINDNYGHIYGDKILKGLAEALKICFGEPEIIGRMGGDEFTVFIPQVYRHGEVLQLGTKLCDRLTARKIEGIQVNCSVGVALAPTHGSTFLKLYNNADKALYMAKSLGKNRCCVYRNDL
ncbi:MAG: diguanylate cyclase [Lachnospiraceae bacterium]|nr:diguanylate cyclase [Lachnospiraceae bacterium]